MTTAQKRLSILSAAESLDAARAKLRTADYRTGVGLADALALLDEARAAIKAVADDKGEEPAATAKPRRK